MSLYYAYHLATNTLSSSISIQNALNLKIILDYADCKLVCKKKNGQQSELYLDKSMTTLLK
jgi:hypothetical protein